MNEVETLEKRQYELDKSYLTCVGVKCRWTSLCHDAISECRRLRTLLDKPVVSMDDSDLPNCPADDEAPVGDPNMSEEK